MLNKVIKNLKKNNSKIPNLGSSSYNQTSSSKKSHNSGFHTKGSSEAGAKRQRSMGNRNTKPPR